MSAALLSVTQPLVLHLPKAIAPIAVQHMRADRDLKVPEKALEMVDMKVDVTMRATRAHAMMPHAMTARAGIERRMTVMRHDTCAAKTVTMTAAANGPHKLSLARIKLTNHKRIT